MVQSGADLDLVQDLIEVAQLERFTVEMVVRAALQEAISNMRYISYSAICVKSMGTFSI